MTTRRDGSTRTCDHDLTHVHEPGRDEFRITGMACGRLADLRVPARP